MLSLTTMKLERTKLGLKSSAFFVFRRRDRDLLAGDLGLSALFTLKTKLHF